MDGNGTSPHEPNGWYSSWVGITALPVLTLGTPLTSIGMITFTIATSEGQIVIKSETILLSVLSFSLPIR